MLPGVLCGFASKSLEVHRARYTSYTSESLATCVKSAKFELYLLFVFLVFVILAFFVNPVLLLRLDPSARVAYEDQHATGIIPNNPNSARVLSSQLPDIQNITTGSVKNEEWVRSRIRVQ